MRGLGEAEVDAGVEAAHLVLPAPPGGEQLLHHQDGVDEVSPAVLQPHSAPAGGDDGSGQDAGGPQAAALRNTDIMT